ncbi:MAG: hypothetical protein OXF79_15315 [Chloroflexi bacterium]|nr:hypothetical protein [Chloroflexota bacterium]
MSGGLHAKRGFNYQDTAILDLLMTHFKEHGPCSTVRPEGVDDLDLAWNDSNGFVQKRFVQVKKPREDMAANPIGASWTLAEVTTDLLPGTLTRLKDNTWEQLWILGDDLTPEARSLVDAGIHAPTKLPKLYWLTVHRLARSQVLARANLDATIKSRLMRWKPSSLLGSNTKEAISSIFEEFRKILETSSSEKITDDYRCALSGFHTVLPTALSRIRIEPMFGSEDEVRERIQNYLHQQYGLDQSIVNATLYRNLRGFISDISAIPGLCFNSEDFEAELRTIWPTMTPIRRPPPLDERYLRRPDLSSIFTSQWKGRALEAMGISGAGKTMLAAEVYERSRKEHPERPVFYIEVRSDTGLRDVLVGISFHLRRYGFPTPFRIASVHAAGNTAHQVALRELARGLAGVPTVFLLLIDLVDGNCSDSFSRDLRTFLNSYTTTSHRLAVLGQESAFRHFSELDREQFCIHSINIRGFKFEEFRKLVGQTHEPLDLSILKQIFDSLTVGRSTGLYAQLARSMADSPSLERMLEIIQSPPGELLQLAERDKFARLSTSARAAAELLICFALPFSRSEAEEVFEEENVGTAIRELVELGLLRHTGTDAFEIHETVRAGLEDGIARSTRRRAHAALAEHYALSGSVAAAILHLEKAGDKAQAHSRARACFLEGRDWTSLANYVIANGLVTVKEAIDTFNSSKAIEGSYIFARVIEAIGAAADAPTLMAVARAQLARFVGDYNWSTAIAEAVLSLAPELVTELYRIALLAAGERERKDAISAILLASRRHGTCDSQSLVALFDSLPDEHKRAFAPVLFDNGSREALRRAFQMVETLAGGTGDHREILSSFAFLRIRKLSDAVEFLAAVPEVDDSRMLALQTPLLGILANYIWRERDCFGSHCVTLLRDQSTELSVQKAAIRILVLIGHSKLSEICDDLSARTEDPIHGFAALAPALMPSAVDLGRYEECLLDPASGYSARSAALAVLASSGADLDGTYRRFCEVEANPDSRRFWDFLFLQMASKRPFAGALPLLRAQLRSSDDRHSVIFAAPLKALGTLPGLDVTTVLLECLAHPQHSVKQAAALSLQERRSRSALAGLRQRLAAEPEKKFRVGLASAIAASGPAGVHELDAPFAGEQNVMLWQCIVAARTSDKRFAPNLVEIGNNRSLSWQLRRAAINAAGFLPFEVALKHMLEILQERSTTLTDESTNLNAHSFLCWLLQNGAHMLTGLFATSRDQFVSVVSEMFVDGTKGSLDAPVFGVGQEVGEWAYCQLSTAGWPDNPEALDVVINELSKPLLYSAILRSLRRVGRTDLIAVEMQKADRPWFAIKCILECIRGGYAGPEDESRLREYIAKSVVANNQRVQRCIEEVASAGQSKQRTTITPRIPEALAFRGLSFAEAVRLLNVGESSSPLDAGIPVLLEQVNCQQFKELVQLADPVNDADLGEETYLPGISFTSGGYTVASRQISYSGGQETPGSLIRPAIVAAKSYGVEIHWQEGMFEGTFVGQNVERVLKCIAVSGNAEMLYELLRRYPEDFLEPLGSHSICEHMAPLIDARMVPIVASNLTTGTAATLESLSELAGMIVSPEIDKVLTFLFARWFGQFQAGQLGENLDSNHHFWRAFRNLTSHPRFEKIDDWPGKLALVLYSRELAWFRKQDVARVLERDPRSYIHLENVLFKSQDWEHFAQEEIDLLDESCNRLFKRVGS